MAIVMMILAAGLAIAAYKAGPGSVRIGLLAFSILNALGAASSITKNDPYAYRLMPNNGQSHDSFRRP